MEKQEIKGQTFTVNGVTFDMMFVKGGTFTMGDAMSYMSGDEEEEEYLTPHSVTLTKDYYIGKTVVTQALWQAVMGKYKFGFIKKKTPFIFKGDNRPAECVSWNDCQEFIEKLNQITGKSFRLPTEAEWEFAARGGINSKNFLFSGSNNITEVGWCFINSGDEIIETDDLDFFDLEKSWEINCQTHDVALLMPNELGIYDMSGNVFEWCNDWFDKFDSSPQIDPVGPAVAPMGGCHVYKGGGFYSPASTCLTFMRHLCSPSEQQDNLGFRLALSV